MCRGFEGSQEQSGQPVSRQYERTCSSCLSWRMLPAKISSSKSRNINGILQRSGHISPTAPAEIAETVTECPRYAPQVGRMIRTGLIR